jgi:hypothetical protein
MKEGFSNRASISKGLHEGDLKGGLLYWGTQNMLWFWKWASSSTVALLLGNMEGRFF